MKDELGGKIMAKFVRLIAKTYEGKTSKRHKKMCDEKNLNLKIIKNCLEETQLDNKMKEH